MTAAATTDPFAFTDPPAGDTNDLAAAPVADLKDAQAHGGPPGVGLLRRLDNHPGRIPQRLTELRASIEQLPDKVARRVADAGTTR